MAFSPRRMTSDRRASTSHSTDHLMLTTTTYEFIRISEVKSPSQNNQIFGMWISGGTDPEQGNIHLHLP